MTNFGTGGDFECACCQLEAGSLGAVTPKQAARSPLYLAVREAQDRDARWLMSRPGTRERIRPATLGEQRLCSRLYGMPVTQVRAWLKREQVKYEGWGDTFRWTAS